MLRMRGAWSELVGPPGLMFLGALICAVGGLWSALKQSELRHASKEQTDLLRDLTARTGNNKVLEELIQARSRALNPDRGKADDAAAAILKRLPALTNEFNAMEENKHDVFENRTADFRLKWEPLVNATLSFFDDLVDKCMKRGINLQRSPNQAVELTAADPQGETTLRGVTCNGAVARIIYTPVVLFPGDSWRDAEMSFHIQDREGRDTLLLRLGLGVDEGRCLWSLPGEPGTSSGNFRAPKDGTIPQEFLDFIHDAFARVFERFLLIAGANNSLRPR